MAGSGSGRSTPVASEDALNNMTATEFQGREAKGEVLQDYMARNFAEALDRLVYTLGEVKAESDLWFLLETFASMAWVTAP